MEYRLEELFDLQMGKTPSRSVTEYWESGNNKWISIADLSKCGKYIYDTKECLSDIAVPESGIKQIPANTVVMSFKLSIGKTAITSEPMYSNEAIMSFRDRKLVQLLPEYIYYLLLSKNWDDGTNKAVMGKTLNKATLSKVKVNIHSMQEQQEIVYVLNQATALIELHQQQLQKLDELVKARFVELFGDPILNQKQFPVYRMDEVVEFQGGSQPDKKFFEYEPTDDNIRLIQIRDYKTDKFITYIPRAMAKRFCTADDIMIGRYGPPIFQILQGIEGSFNVALMKATPKKGNKEFVRQFLKQECLLDYLEGMSKRTAGQDGIQMDKLKAYPFPLPPVELQNQFEKFANQVDKSKVAVQKSLDEAQLLFDSLMQQYFG